MYYWNLDGFSRYIPEVGKTVYVGIDAAHCQIMQIIAMQGLPAALAYLATILSSVVLAVKRRDLLALLPLLCCFIQSFFNVEMCITSAVFWIFAAVSAGNRRENIVQQL
jgi:O-antigen ligase